MDTLDDYHTHIAKRKRTKRQRTKSPMPFSVADTHSMSGDSNGDNFNSVNSNVVLSSINSSEFAESTAEEEEEMANCLILLAQGNYSNKQSSIGCDHGQMGMKFTSKRISKLGNYVYQCQTCDRTFPSFQALGGHRASHKKSMNKQLSDEEKDEQFKAPLSYPDSVPLQLINGNRNFRGNSNGSSKIHECWICGAEFASGQALGGHMSRHRTSGNCYEAKGERSVMSLDLDLNLPAPESDHERESKFSFAPEQSKEKQLQQSALLLSTAPALVDCRY